MAKFRVQRRATVWFEITVDAENEDEALKIGGQDESLWEHAEEIRGSFEYDDYAELWISEEEL